MFAITTVPTTATTEQWQSSVCTALYNAAQATYYTEQQAINAQIAALQNQINSVDTLTLRREENDEIMKCALRWILGPGFDFMPSEVLDLFGPAHSDAVNYGVGFTGNDLPLSFDQWSTMYTYQEVIKFINEAIEWENVIYYLYSYFWDTPPSWSFIRQIQHPDPTRQAFLRAGSARVVLAVRPGFEIPWCQFVDQGDFNQLLPPGHPYFTIAQQIQAYNATNYPGIPPANPGAPVDDDEPQVGTTCNVKIPIAGAPLDIPVADIDGFVKGASVIIDTWDAAKDPVTGLSNQEIQTITAITGNTITVASLSHSHDGTVIPFPVVQAGQKGVLIAEWFEYTPTSGTDIAVTSNLATVAPPFAQ